MVDDSPCCSRAVRALPGSQHDALAVARLFVLDVQIVFCAACMDTGSSCVFGLVWNWDQDLRLELRSLCRCVSVKQVSM